MTQPAGLSLWQDQPKAENGPLCAATLFSSGLPGKLGTIAGTFLMAWILGKFGALKLVVLGFPFCELQT